MPGIISTRHSTHVIVRQTGGRHPLALHKYSSVDRTVQYSTFWHMLSDLDAFHSLRAGNKISTHTEFESKKNSMLHHSVNLTPETTD